MHAGNNPERASAAHAPAPLGANLRFDPCYEQKLPLDGRDILPVLTQGASSPHEEILLNSSPRAGAIRVGDWKLVLNGSVGSSEEDDESPASARGKKAGRRNQSPKMELFNLAQNLSEKHDLATENPDKVKELRARYDAYAKQAAKPGNMAKAPGYTVPKVYGEQELPAQRQ